MLNDWRRGIDDFNQARWWHAHESWEQGWTRLAEPSKSHLQSLIQVCGVLHLLEKGRLGPVVSLGKRALELARQAEGGVATPRIEIPGALDYLAELVAAVELSADGSTFEAAPWLERARGLKARLIELPAEIG